MQCPSCGHAEPGAFPECPSCGRRFASRPAPPETKTPLVSPFLVRAAVYGLVLFGVAQFARAKAEALVDAKTSQAESTLNYLNLEQRRQAQALVEENPP